MAKLFDVVTLRDNGRGTIVEDYGDGAFMVEIPREGLEPELRDITLDDIVVSKISA